MSGATQFSGTPVLFNLTNLQAPASGITHALRLVMTAANGTPITFSPQNFVSAIGRLFQAQAMTVDNSSNTEGLMVSEIIYGWSQYVNAGQKLTFNFPAVQSPTFEFTPDGASITFSVDFFDWPVFNFANQNNNNASGLPITASTNDPLPTEIVGGITGNGSPVSRSLTSNGASQTLAPANGNRKYLLIGAPQTAPIWINFLGGAASAGGADCFQVQAGGFFESNLYVSNDQINIFCASTGLEIPAIEG
jgi:hypothetical protein